MRPETEAELAEVLRAARGPLAVRGGGTRLAAPPEGEVLDASALSGVTLYEPGALTLVARAGTPVAQVVALLAAQGQRLAFEPGDWRGLLGTGGASTIGGVVAANASGPRRVQAGAARDALLGVRFVDGTGSVIRNGGRVMKNVTGYDLVKLVAGSFGTLGVLTEVSLKVLPRPESTSTLQVAAETAETAVTAMSAALISPYDVTGAAWLPGRGVFVRIEGFAASVAYRAERLAARLMPAGAVTFAEGDIWRDVADVAPFHGRSGDVWRIALRPSLAPAAVARIGGEVMLDWGGGLIWALVPEGTDLRARLGAVHGHATLMRASAGTFRALGRFHPEAPEVRALTDGLRARFDPRGILNRDLMTAGRITEGAGA